MAEERYSWAEIRKHNSKRSCWIVVDNGVYDMTDFLDDHPGGKRLPLKHAGKDVTEVWNQIHGHKKEAILKEYAHLRVGVVDSGDAQPPPAAAAAPAAAASATAAPAAAAPAPAAPAPAAPAPAAPAPAAPAPVAPTPAVIAAAGGGIDKFLRLSRGSDGTARASADDWWRIAPRAFGGQLVAHCIVAAAQRAPAGWPCHSCHVHFVSPGQFKETAYEVRPLREGRAYALFEVRAVEQPGGALVVAGTVSFHDVAGERRRGAAELMSSRAPETPPPPPMPPPTPPAGPARSSDWSAKRRAREGADLWWLGWPAPLPLGSVEQYAALAFLSDLRGVGSAVAHPHRATRRIAKVTSLDHTLHFHAPPAAPLGWVLVQLDSPWAADGRAMVRMRFWSPAGELLATAVQEAVLRTEARDATTPVPVDVEAEHAAAAHRAAGPASKL